MSTVEQNNRRRMAGDDGYQRTGSRYEGSGRSAGLNRPRTAAAGSRHAGAAKKSRKDIAKDKLLILLEVLAGLLVLSMFAFGAAKVFSLLGNMKKSGFDTSAISDQAIIIVFVMLLGILILFAGMISGRVARLKWKLKLGKNQRLVMLILALIGVMGLVIAYFLGSALPQQMKTSGAIDGIVLGLGRVAYIVLGSFVLILAVPIFGEIVYLGKDKGNSTGRKLSNLLLKLIGAGLILTALVLTCRLVTSRDIMSGMISNAHELMDLDNSTTADKIQTNLSTEQAKHMSGYINIAVFGIDSRADKAENEEAGALVDSDSRSDVIMLVSVNCDTKKVKLLSVYRDTCVLIQKKGAKDKSSPYGYTLTETYEKITHAYFYGSLLSAKDASNPNANRGPEFALNAVNRNLDLNITEYVAVNFDIVRQVIEELGGLEIDIDKGELKYINQYIDEINKLSGTNSPHITETGLQHLDGVQATGYARIRHSDSEYKRTERQREVVQLMLEKAKTMGIGKVMEIVGLVAPQVRTNIQEDRFTEMAQDVLNYEIEDQAGFPFDPYWDSNDSVVYPGGAVSNGVSLADEVVNLHKFLFGEVNYTPSSKLQKISDEIDARRGKKGSKSSDSDSTSTRTTQKPQEEEPEYQKTAKPDNSNNEDQNKTTTIVVTPKPTSTPEPEPIVVATPTPEPPAVVQTPEPEPAVVQTPEPEPAVVQTPEPDPVPVAPDEEPEDDPGL